MLNKISSEVANILYTFDVEVYFGKSGSTKVGVFENTIKILETLTSSGTIGIFFLDATHMFYSCERNETHVTEFYVRLIKKLRDSGQDIGLHLHPHWIDAGGLDPNYNFQELKNYSTGYVANNNPEILNEIITKFLDIVRNVDPTYSVSIFRAGGYCAQPSEKLFSILAKHGIWIDSSVVPKMKCNTAPFQFNYSNILSNEAYHFDDDNALPVSNAPRIELPVFSYRLTFLRRLFEKLKRASNKKYTRYSKGKGLTFSNKFIEKFAPTYKILTTDDADKNDFSYAIKTTHSSLIMVVNHPKLLSEQGLTNLREVTEKYSGTTLKIMTTKLSGGKI